MGCYHMNDRSMSLDDLQARLEQTDLIPSHQPLLDGLTKKIGVLKKAGLQSIADLRIRLKNEKSIAFLAEDIGIDFEYLVLLRRVVEGFFPKPMPLKIFDWLDKNTIAKLEQAGVTNTLALYETASHRSSAFAKKMGLGKRNLEEVMALADLSRMQWVSPTFARTLVAAGFNSAGKVSKASPEALYEAIMRANANARFYKGKVGMRDIKRLIAAAAYVPDS